MNKKCLLTEFAKQLELNYADQAANILHSDRISVTNCEVHSNSINFLTLTTDQLTQRQRTISVLNTTHNEFISELLAEEVELGITDNYHCHTFDIVSPYLPNFYRELWKYAILLTDYYTERRKRLALKRENLRSKTIIEESINFNVP